METPVDTAAGAGRLLYGERWETINRRALLAGLATLALPARAFAAPRDVRRLWWRGTARVIEPTRTLELTVETELDLLDLGVRSTSYPTAQGPASARTLILTSDAVWLERAGTRTALSTQLGVHERQQYSIYARLLRLQQRARRPAPGPLLLAGGPGPDILFRIGPDGRPATAELTVAAAETGRPAIHERVVFSGSIIGNGVRWPRRFALSQDGKPYFDLTIAEFRAT